jgi:hypothetical protein
MTITKDEMVGLLGQAYATALKTPGTPEALQAQAAAWTVQLGHLDYGVIRSAFLMAARHVEYGSMVTLPLVLEHANAIMVKGAPSVDVAWKVANWYAAELIQVPNPHDHLTTSTSEWTGEKRKTVFHELRPYQRPKVHPFVAEIVALIGAEILVHAGEDPNNVNAGMDVTDISVLRSQFGKAYERMLTDGIKQRELEDHPAIAPAANKVTAMLQEAADRMRLPDAR